MSTTYAYDGLGDVQTQTTNGVLMATCTYDLLGELLTTTDANGNTTTYTYNAFGLVRSKALPGDSNIPGLTVTSVYDLKGRLADQYDTMNHEVVCAYDNQDHVLSKTTQQKNATVTPIVEKHAYDVRGSEIYTTDPNGNKTTGAYDALGRLISASITVSGIVEKTSYTYDKDGSKTSVTDWLGNKVQYNYDPLGRLCSTVNQLGVTAETLAYDDLNRQIT